MTPTQSERSEGTKRQILDAAAAAFARDGYAATSLNDVIRQSELTKGAFYFHFPSKEALALAVVDDLRDQWSLDRQTRRSTSRGRRRSRRDRWRPTLSRVQRQQQLPRARAPRARARRDAAGPRPGLQASLFMWIDFIEAIVSRGQADGVFRTDLSRARSPRPSSARSTASRSSRSSPPAAPTCSSASTPSGGSSRAASPPGNQDEGKAQR